MNPNEIKKDLEHEIHLAEYVDSNYCNSTEVLLIKSALAYINQLEAEVERVKTAYPKTLGSIKKIYTTAKSDAIKDFAERVDKELLFTSQNEICADCLIMARRIVNNLKEEMVGDDNGT
jgi:hypothetical protein